MELRALIPPGGPVTPADAMTGLRLGELAPGDRPYVVTNMVSTADGKIAIEGRAGPIGDEADKQGFRWLRTQGDALLIGTSTLRVERYASLVGDEDRRAARIRQGLDPVPLLCVISRSGDIPFDIPLFADPESRAIVFAPHGTAAPGCAAQVEVVTCDPSDLRPAPALRRLRRDYGVRSVVSEGGPTLNGALLEDGVLDELFLTIAPKLVAGSGLTAVAGPRPLPAVELELVRALERDGSLFLRYRIRHGRAAASPGDV